MAVCNCHDLGPFAAPCFTNCRAPFFAPAKEASMAPSLSRAFPAALDPRPAPVKSLRNDRPSAISENAGDRFDRVDNDRVSPFQGAPVRKIHNTPCNTARASRGGRPLPSTRRGSTNTSRRMSHWASVRSMPLIARKIDPSHLYYLPGTFCQINSFHRGLFMR